MRVLCAAPGAFGHVNPMVPLARALRARGHAVSWATSPELLAHLATLGFDGHPAGVEQAERFARLRRLHPELPALPQLERRTVMYRGLFAEVGVPAMLPGLAAAAERFGPDLILHDANELTSPLLAFRLGIPNVAHSFGALVPPALVQSAAGTVRPLWQAEGRDVPPFAGLYTHAYVDLYPAALQPFPLGHIERVLPMRPEVAEPDAAAVLPASAARLPAPLVYATFGTAFTSDELFRPILGAARRVDASFLVTVGPHGDVGALGASPDNVVVAQYVPQAAVLQRASVVVSHGGSGTFLAALTRGLPQVCIPQGADQFVNAEAGARLGAAVMLAPDGYDEDALVDVLLRLLAGDDEAAAARRVAASIAGMPSPDAVAAQLEVLVAG